MRGSAVDHEVRGYVLTYVREEEGLAAFVKGEDGSELTAVNGKMRRICDVRIIKWLKKLAVLVYACIH